MASINLNVAAKNEWPLANPWLWLGGGAALTVWSLVWTLMFRPEAADLRIVVLAAGLLLLGAGIWMRQRDRQTSYIRDHFPGLAAPLRLLLGLLFALAVIGATTLLVLAFLGRPGAPHIEPAILIFVMMTPLAANAALRCLRRSEGQPALEVDEEIGLAYCVLGGCCFLGTITLNQDPSDPESWDSFRMLLRVGTFLSGYAAGLMVCSALVSRLMLSLVFVLHFCGISSAALAAPPSAWIVQQAWMRVFRPYLEFMYLNNAYHFYAPDPGPSSYLWFRIIYTSDDGKTDFGKWYKLPEMDEQGRIKHPVALEYQRYLAMTESIAQKDQLPSEVFFNEEKQEWQPQPMYLRRLNLSDPKAPIQLGSPDIKQPRIPLHPEISKQGQVNIPADMPRRLLSSFARHAAYRFPTHVDEQGNVLKFKSVKIYRVIHAIPPIGWYQLRLSPTDPVSFHPYYMGNYRANGHRINDGDPYLWWMVPILREHANQVNSKIFDYCRYHAGDPNWKLDLADWK